MKKSVVVAANSYTVDFAAHKIIATSEFMAKAGQYGSAEYTTIMNLRKDLPDFTIEVLADKKPNKKKGCLTLSTMEAYIIREFGEDSDEIKEFDRVREASKDKKSGRFSYMMKWLSCAVAACFAMISGCLTTCIRRPSAAVSTRKPLPLCCRKN